MAAINLIVIRSHDIDKSAAFYRLIGLNLVKHRHATGPEHYVWDQSGLVFEIYPETEKPGPSTGTRLGFRVGEVATVVARLVDHGATVITPSTNAGWGEMAIVADPDGHRVELME